MSASSSARGSRRGSKKNYALVTEARVDHVSCGSRRYWWRCCCWRPTTALHLSAVSDVLFSRLSEQARRTLGVGGQVSDHRSFLARYRQVRYLFSKVAAVLDPSGLAKNRRLTLEEFAACCRVVSEDEELAARGRLESFMGRLLGASVDEAGVAPATLAYGLDATAVPLFSRGPSKRANLCASDPDGGWYVREGDHREREDHKGRTRSRVAWALEATVLTTASSEPGTLSSFPNLVVGLAHSSGHRSRRDRGARARRRASARFFAGSARR